MKFVLNFVLFVILSLSISQISTAQSGPGMNRTNGTGPGPSHLETGISTMFARDPLTQSLCFKDGSPGRVFEDGQPKNRCSDLNFDSYSANGFTVGIEGGREGVIIDLGTPQELKAKYGYAETVGGGQGFASIDVKNGKALISKDYRTGRLQEMTGSEQLFRTPTDQPLATVPVMLGHIYLLRVIDTYDKSFELLAKVLVVAHVPGESVTVRWAVISNNETAKLR